jgi:hypothetical protein
VGAMFKSLRKGTYTNRAFRVYELPPSLRFPPLREGNREGRVGSVPPACRGNLMEGVIGHTRFCELWLRDWYYYEPAGIRYEVFALGS